MVEPAAASSSALVPPPPPPAPDRSSLRFMLVAAGITLIEVLLIAWFTTHSASLPSVLAAVAAQAPLAVLKAAWDVVAEREPDKRRRLIDALSSPRVVTATAAVVAALVLLTSMTSSVRVAAAASSVRPAVRLYRVTPPSETERAGSIEVSGVGTLNELNLERSFLVWVGPGARRFSVYTSRQRFHNDVRARPWRPAELTYDDDFDSAVAITALPTPKVFEQGPVRLVVVRVTAPQDTVADGRLNAMSSVLLSVVPASPADSSDVRRWRAIASSELASDDPEEPVPAIVLDQMTDAWRSRSHIGLTTPLRRGDTVEIVIFSRNDRVTARKQLTLREAWSDVIIRSHP